jgi:hypothetical protein
MRSGWVALVVSCAPACASSKFVVNRTELEKVHSAAIIGFSVDLSGLATGTKVNTFPPPHWREQGREQASLSYRAVVERLAGIGWDMLEEFEVSSNEEYEDEYMYRTAHNFLISDTTSPRLFIRGIMWDSDVWDLEPEDRSRLLDALEVDALVVVRVSFSIDRFEAVGFVGRVKHHPQAHVALAVYDGNSPEPIWRDFHAQGATTPIGFAHSGDPTPSLLEALELGLDALTSRYRAAGK